MRYYIIVPAASYVVTIVLALCSARKSSKWVKSVRQVAEVVLSFFTFASGELWVISAVSSGATLTLGV